MKNFVDLAKIKIKAGDGGDGIVSFRREKFVPKGGPDGGDGGDGGDVYLQADPQMGTLYDFTHRGIFKAEDGGRGGPAKRTGRSGEDLVLQVPVGTCVYTLPSDKSYASHMSDGERLSDLSEPGQKVLVARGGQGGRGNVHFKAADNQVPRHAEEGTPGEAEELLLELKLIADVGLIGLPNAGKSTLLSTLTAAKPKIANYPFTTIDPNLGVMEYQDQRLVIADLPGLIEGAAEGKGLGDDFLRHVERTKVLVHMVASQEIGHISPTQLMEAYRTVRDELEQYSQKLAQKPEIVVLNKTDLTEIADQLGEIQERFLSQLDIEPIPISAATGEGLELLKEVMLDAVAEEEARLAEVEEEVETPVPVFTIDDLQHFG